MNTQDILNLTLAACTGILTIFISFFIYNATIIIKRIRETIEIITDTLHRIEDGVDFVKEKITKTSSYIPLIIDGAKKLMSYIEERKH